MYPDKSVPTKKVTLNGNSAQDRVWTGKNGNLNREVLVTIEKSQMATLIHFVYRDLTTTDSRMADGIIASVRQNVASK